jgi:hypothetical protein
MKKLFVEINHSGRDLVEPLSKNGIFETVWQDCLYRIPREIAEKYGLKAGDSRRAIAEKYKDDSDEYDEIFDRSDGAPVHYDTDYVDLDELEDNCLYYDTYNDELYTADTIRGWETVKCFEHYDHELKEIVDEVELDVKEVWRDEHNTGAKICYKPKKGKRFIVNSSRYQGSIDYVENISSIAELKKLAKIGK